MNISREILLNGWLKYLKTRTMRSAKYIEKEWGFIYLECAPNVKED